MPLLARTVTAPLVVEIGAGTIAALPDLLRDRRISPGGDVAFLLGPGQGAAVAERLGLSQEEPRAFLVKSAAVQDCEALATEVRHRSYDAIVGIGGGRTLDVAKWVGTRLGIPSVSVATSLSHDGIASPVSVLEFGARKNSYGVQIPLAVLVDTEFVARSDCRITRAGIGDVMSNLSAIADWEMAHERRGEPKDGLALAMARTAAHSVLESSGHPADPPFLANLAEALVLSGLAMAVAGSSRPCSGACHEISHALDEEATDRSTLHGEQVGVGALYATFLRGDVEGFRRLGDAMRRFGLAMTPADLGLAEDEFVRAVLAAPATRPERYTVLEELAMDEGEVRASVGRFLGAVASAWPGAGSVSSVAVPAR